MPRIEIIDTDIKDSPSVFPIPESGPSPTVDVCRKCASKFIEDYLDEDTLDDLRENNALDADIFNAKVGSVDVEHPPYFSDYWCDLCGDPLTEVDN